MYPAELLFSWRELHEKETTKKLGSKGDRISASLKQSELEEFEKYPPIIRRILMDRPPGWEWRLTAELMRHLNNPVFRKLEDLREGHYTRPLENVTDDDFHDWFQTRSDEMAALIEPLKGLLTRLSASWGEPGQSGSVEEIHHTCCLIEDNLKQIAQHEERLRFTRVSSDFRRLVSLLHDCLGSQAEKLKVIPDRLDDILSRIDEYEAANNGEVTVIKETIVIELPPNWEKQMEREMRRVGWLIDRKHDSGEVASASGFFSSFFGFIIVVGLLTWIFI